MSSKVNTELNAGNESFRTFEDLEIYQVAREFRTAMYAVSRRLPDHEKFGLADQIRRAAVSLTNNIAEGHGRYHFADQIRFLLQARGSLEELLDDLNVCSDERYLDPATAEQLKSQGWATLRLINGYARYLRNRRLTGGTALHEASEPQGADLLDDGDDPFAGAGMLAAPPVQAMGTGAHGLNPANRRNG